MVKFLLVLSAFNFSLEKHGTWKSDNRIKEMFHSSLPDCKLNCLTNVYEELPSSHPRMCPAHSIVLSLCSEFGYREESTLGRQRKLFSYPLLSRRNSDEGIFSIILLFLKVK